MMIRNKLQYDFYLAESMQFVLIHWVIHYFALAILAAILFATCEAWKKFFFYQKNDFYIDMDRSVYIVACLAIIVPIAMFFLAHWPSSIDEPY